MTSKPSETVAAQPLPAPKRVRERKFGVASVSGAIALIVVGGLAAMALFAYVRGGDLYVAVARPVAFGQQITADDLTSVRVSAGSGLSPVADADKNTVIGKYASVPLVPGALLSKEQVAQDAMPGKGKLVLSVTLKSDRAPAHPLQPGVPVLLVRTQDSGIATTPEAGAVPVGPVNGTVYAVRQLEYGGGVVVDVIVAAGDGPLIAGAATTGHVALLVAQGTTR